MPCSGIPGFQTILDFCSLDLNLKSAVGDCSTKQKTVQKSEERGDMVIPPLSNGCQGRSDPCIRCLSLAMAIRKIMRCFLSFFLLFDFALIIYGCPAHIKAKTQHRHCFNVGRVPRVQGVFATAIYH